MIKRKFLLLVLVGIVNVAFSQSFKADRYTFVFLNKNSDAVKISKEESEKIMEGHMANINKLASEKKLLAAGPFEGGGGIFVLNTLSTDEAMSWLQADPGVQAKRWNLELLPFHNNVGGICPVSAPYEMVMYTFVRFKTLITKSTITSYAKTFGDHTSYIAKVPGENTIVTTGTFGEHDGSILVAIGDLDEDFVLQDPAVQEGLVEYEIKKLYIAKGSFCE